MFYRPPAMHFLDLGLAGWILAGRIKNPIDPIGPYPFLPVAPHHDLPSRTGPVVELFQASILPLFVAFFTQFGGVN